ncbi:hypothetical protein SAMN02745116_01748 [Pilibacter termitis]|uniref:Uncharacterized protein n=1 Tax=Pilibacter termitis TaxID=263852 RepID=A0A1T4PBY9_9ENTE|nr:hypothetical protein [Pilibacter termitis]SJZ89095.1 hypothetical protein SAMN02745116_01748 [Pilibacter termitis]
MARKNIYDLLNEHEIDTRQEYERLWTLLRSRSSYSATHNYSVSVLQIIEKEFLNFKRRVSFVSFHEMVRYFQLPFREESGYFPAIVYGVSLDELNCFIELILLVFQELEEINHKGKYDFAEAKAQIKHNIHYILEKIAHKIIEIRPKQLIVVPSDDFVNAVADIILPEDEQLALAVLGYSHYSHKADIEEKGVILKQLVDYVEPKLKIVKDSNLSFVLNKYYAKQGENATAPHLNAEEMIELYDGLYKNILFYIMKQEINDLVEGDNY